jgi:hypothetical protein
VLTKLIEEAGEGPDPEGEVTVTKEEISKAVKECAEEALKPFKDKLAALEKDGGAGTEDVPPKDGGGNSEEIAELVKSAVKEAIDPIEERIGKLEQARGIRNSIPEDESLRKDADGGLWGNVF